MAIDGAKPDGALSGAGEDASRPELDGHVVPGKISAEISRTMVGIYRKRLGRGPTKSRTTANVNMVMVAFEDTLTTAEQTLLDQGKDEHVISMRLALANSMRDEAITAIEVLVGRTVKAYVSGLDPGANVAVQVFLLDPVQETGELGVTETGLGGEVETLT